MKSSDDIYRHPWEKLASQYLDGLRQGAPPPLEEITADCPEDAAEVRELLQLVSAMEGWKTRRELSAMRQTMPDLFRFERLGDCRLIREIGRGGMGVVFEAEQESLRRRVAVKVLPWRFPQASRLRERFQHEAVLAGKLRHKHIVPVYQFGEQDGWCYYVMHLVPGVGLDRVIRRLSVPPHEFRASEVLAIFHRQTSRLPLDADDAPEPRARRPWWRKWLAKPETESGTAPSGWSLKRNAWLQFARLGQQVAEGLRYAHAEGILHRDIKPGNLLLDERRRLWIADFGLAQIDRQAEQPDAQNVAGTLRYVAPEQLAGLPDVRSDLYSLGMTLYELCTLQPAFDDRDRAQLIRSVRERTPQSPHALNAACPPELSRLVMRLIAKRPEDRFQTADELIAALSEFQRQRDSREK